MIVTHALPDQVIPRGHLRGVTATHTCCVGGTWYVQVKDDEEMKTSLGIDVKDAVTMEMKYGSVLLMNNAIPHRRYVMNSPIIIVF